MELWKKNLMLVGSSALMMLILSLLDDGEEDEENEEDEPLSVDDRGLMHIVDIIHEKAEIAMDACHTPEEREAVYGDVEKNIQNLKQNLQEKGADILRELRARDAGGEEDGRKLAEATEKAAGTNRMKALRGLEQSTKEVIEGLDDVLASLKTKKEGS